VKGKQTMIQNPLLPGVKAAWPICLGYIPIGLAFGVLAQKAGMTWFQIVLMSSIVFAGSSQFIAVSMLANGSAALAVIMTTFFVNLRHLLMSSSLATLLRNEHRGKLSVFAYGVTDESFAINYTRLLAGDWDLNRSLVLNHTANACWILSTVAGGFFGHLIPAHSLGIDYALIAMFICLLVFQLTSRLIVLTAIIAGVLSVALALLIPGNSYIVLASVIAATIGIGVSRLSRTIHTRRGG
jgi:4-azaleucine resistance transporter AzlC